MRGRMAAVIALLAMLTAGAPGSRAAAEDPVDRLRAYSIVPPGQDGTVTAEMFATGEAGPHFDDQRELYASLIDDDDVSENELGKYFHSMQFGVSEDPERTYEPRPGVTVARDSLGIPHITADSLEDASFGLGYVTAEDRLWQMDVFRHAARGRLSEFIGPSFLEMDIATRREGYTEEEILATFDDLDEKFGAAGRAVQSGLQAYADGVNAYVSTLATNPARVPAEYAATGNPYPLFPQEWTPADTLFLVVLQLREFGETAGFELQNAGLYAHLTERLGIRLGRKVFRDLVFDNEPRSYTSIQEEDGRWPSQNLGKVKWSSVAVPDDAVELARATLGAEARRARFLARMGFSKPASNAIIASGRITKSGNPMQVGAPQVGYSVPQFFMEVDVHAPGVDFRGPAVPGASALIPLGRGRDYAWTLTTGYSDAVDVRAEQLCDPAGGDVTTESTGYLFKGECREMEAREETFIVKPSPADPGEPSVETRTIYRTHHGPVFARTTVKGKPVGLVKQRFFWMKEIDSIPPFYQWNAKVRSIHDFADAAGKFTMSFNAHYVDARDIGYFHVGFYPTRSRGVHPALPVWGTGSWEWKGRQPYRNNPKVVNPKQGWLVNWNNKPAAAWDNFDGIKWGSIHRVRLLADEMARRVGRGKIQLSDLVDVIRIAATQDVRGVYLGPRMLRMINTSGSLEKSASGFVRTWIRNGAHRQNSDRDENMDASPAVAIFDRWYRATVHGIFDDELGAEAYDLIQVPVLGQSMWFDFSSYLERLFDGRMGRNYCNDRATPARETCRQVVREAFRQAVTELAQEQGEDPSAWKAPAEWIEFSAQGGMGVEDIPWQNRGTHNHVVEVLGRAR